MELEEIIDKMDNFKQDISNMLPDLSFSLQDDILDKYYRLKQKAEKGDMLSMKKYLTLKPAFQEPLKELMKISLN